MTTRQRPAVPIRVDRQDVENFLYREARLIDEGRLDEWLALFPDDTLYWVPANKDKVDPTREVSFIWDNHEHLSDRVWRLQSGLAHTTDPPSKTRRLITNVEVGEADGSEVDVRCNMALFQLRRGVQSAFIAHCIYRLRQVDGDWKIASKKVELLNNGDPIRSLQFIL